MSSLHIFRAAAAQRSITRVATVPLAWTVGRMQVVPLAIVPAVRQNTQRRLVRCFSAQGGAGQTAGGATGSAQGAAEGEGQAPPEEGAYDADEPFVAKASRILWNTIKYSVGISAFGLIMYAGYTIVTTLLPVGASSNAVMRAATDILLHNPDVHNYYGDAKTYGLDPGGRSEGRRYFVPEYKYEDPLTGESYHRVKFNLEGERGRKAAVYAEVKEGSYDFRYLILVAKDGSKVISVIDHRPPPMSVSDRQSRVTSLIQDAGWVYYSDNEVDTAAQRDVLADYWLKVKCVRCDENPARCEEAGVTSKPVWGTGGKSFTKGPLDLAGLERLVQPLVKEKKKGWFS